MTSRAILAVTSCLASVAAARGAAGAAPAVEIRAEGGIGSILTRQQKDLGYGLALGGSLHPGLRVLDMVSAELALSTWFFPADAGAGRATLFGAGARVDPRLPAMGARLILDGHAGWGLTGSNDRFMFDLGLGVEFPLGPRIAIGPFVRYGHMLTAAGDLGADPKFVTLGVAFALRFPPPAAPVVAPPAPAPKAAAPGADRDGDGVADALDQCPDRPAGDHPDARRKGCPALDSDGDGVLDDDDKCFLVPQGPMPDPDRPGCPDPDDDGDGVPNGQDKCKAERSGLNPDPTALGCPLPDRDGDTVPDIFDACSDKPGAPDTNPRKNGCPGLVQIEGGMIKIMKPVFFATGKDKILPRSFPVLRAVTSALKATPGIIKVSIEGHTDNQGDAEKNLELSERRAASVHAWLVTGGIDATRLQSKGFGDTKPVTENRTSRGRAKNRRVEFVIIDPAPAAPATPAAPPP